MLLKASTSFVRVFYFGPANTSLTIALTISKAGGAFGNPSAGATNLTEMSLGYYKATLSTTDTNTAGCLAYGFTGVTVDNAADFIDQVTAPVNVESLTTGAILAASFAAGAIDAAAIADNAIDAATLATGTITAAKFAAGAIDAAAIADSAIDANTFAAGAITAAAIADGAIDAATFAAGAITSAVIATGAIDADALAADVITDIWSGTALTEAYAADGAAATPAQLLYMIWAGLSEFAISGVTITAKKLDGSTTAFTHTLDHATLPTSRTRAT